MSEEEPHYIRKSEQIIEDKWEWDFSNAYSRLQRILNGQGCLCATCKHDAVNEMNRCSDWGSKGVDPIVWYVDDKLNILWKHRDDQ